MSGPTSAAVAVVVELLDLAAAAQRLTVDLGDLDHALAGLRERLDRLENLAVNDRTRPETVDADGITHRPGCALPGWEVTDSRALPGWVLRRCWGCGAVSLARASTVVAR